MILMDKRLHLLTNFLHINVRDVEILKIVVHEYMIKANEPWDTYLMYRFRQILKNLIDNSRLDVLIYMCCDAGFGRFFNIRNYIQQCLDLMAIDQLRRERFYKKECKLLEKLFKLSPCLIHQLYEDGNDPLIYRCVKVYGCRHRIIEFLIQIGANLQRMNFKEQNVVDVLQLQRNQKLLKNN
ncbi:unnamed protein product [Rotaria sp. Silwood2]|nr:unnamed protein product [Rotaria sp. Silwood2]